MGATVELRDVVDYVDKLPMLIHVSPKSPSHNHQWSGLGPS